MKSNSERYFHLESGVYMVIFYLSKADLPLFKIKG